ncbi:MAG: DUF1289 domain-containing protein [Bacteroidales bacterium]|nr:DUF1289 domain-containing protein [Bacteroidales bacterium]
MKEIKNPCRSICRYDEEKVCIGCHRTMEEAAGWPFFSEEQKAGILENIEERKNRIKTGSDNYERYV